MAQAQKRCPICETYNPKKAAYCMNCGASLAHAELELGTPKDSSASRTSPTTGYDFRYGETDLSEDGLSRKAQVYLASLVGVLIVLVLGALAYGFAPSLLPQPSPTPSPSQTLDITLTPSATLALATVTQGQPTDTPTPTPTETFTPAPTETPSPCVQVVGAGEGMLALISRCGHASLDVIPLVVTLNGLNNENDLRANQTILIPFPTPTFDPNSVPTAPPAGEGASGANIALSDASVQTVALPGVLSEDDIRATQAVNPFFLPTATNPPGVGEHRVAFGQTIIEIISLYQTNIDSIDKLNPQMDFFQCEMGQTFGGPACVVPLFEGQLIRVPVPTPTPTFTFTPNGSETPTPTPTPTVNAPSLSSPSNRAYFRRDERVTLRWTATGTLGLDETYLVTVQNLTEGLAFSAETRDLSYILPPQWQSDRPAQVEYVWTVGIATQGNPQSARYTTLPSSFTWEGRGEPTP